MSIKIFKHLINPETIYNLLKLSDLDKSQYWSYEKLKSFQDKRLRYIIKYAYNNIPGHKSKFDQAGIKPADIKTQKDLYKIPVTTREELQENPDFINKKRVFKTLYTGGSTGTSLKYYDDIISAIIRLNVHKRGWEWNGYRYKKDKLAVVSSAQGAVKTNQTLFLCGDLTQDNLKINVEKLIEFKSPYIRGYVGSLYILAKYCLDNDIDIDFIKSVNPISENLYDYQREVMEKAFTGAKVFEEYCCNDGGACAWECEAHEGLHYFMERAIIESDENGEMIVTDLWNTAIPFIRYKNGDKVQFLDKKCSCGRESPLIKVKGRENDFLISPEGAVGATYLMNRGIGYKYLSKNGKKEGVFKSGINSVQYIQKPGFVIDINIVKNPWCIDEEIMDFRKILETEVLRGMIININFVDEIPKSEKGKRQFIINEDKELLKQYRDKTRI
ncbi:MAG: hypothetical protein PHC34_13620 [Candidatus Gastranaerophilales bacterium]|nr:hypothetical protein [Candidatus Gastranaerophilales bacterium]